MCRLCQATATGKESLCGSRRDQSSNQCDRARANSREQVSNMTWSKESIGNSSTVEATPSGNASRKGKYESIRRGRRPNGSTRIVARKRSMRVADSESVRRMYLTKTQLTLQSQPADLEQQRESTPSSDGEAVQVAPKRQASVRRTHAFRRSSRSRQAFKERGARLVVPTTDAVSPLPTATGGDTQRQSLVLRLVHDDSSDSADDVDSDTETRPRTVAVQVCITLPVDPTLPADTDICSLSSVKLTINEEKVKTEDRDVGPEPVKLLETAVNKDECKKVDVDLDVMPEPVKVSAEMEEKSEEKRQDVGPEPVEILDSVPNLEADRETKVQSTEEKRPSMLRRMLRRSMSRRASRKTTKGMNRRQPPQARRRRMRAPVKRMLRRPRKVVVMGDMFSGKSNLISAYCRDKFSTNYIPTLLNTCLTDAKVFGESIELVVVEVVGRDDYAKLRKCAYHKIDAVILCYSADNPDSLGRIIDYWVPELKCLAPKVPFILVATKKDIRDQVLYDEKSTSAVDAVVSTSRGQKVAKSIGAHTFLECSARYRDNTRNVFETAAKVALQKSRRKRKVRRNCQNDCIVS